jgi:hypothetical protein
MADRWARRGTRQAALASQVALVLICLSGCGVEYGGANRQACGLDAESPHISEGELDKGRLAIVGKVRVLCEAGVEEHRLTRYLEIKIDGEWVRQTDEPARDLQGLCGRRVAHDVVRDGPVPGSALRERAILQPAVEDHRR